MMPAIPTLETARLRLRAPSLKDFPDSLAMWRDEGVARHTTGRPATPEEAWARLLRYVGHWCLIGYGYWVVERIADGAYVGEVGFADFHRDITPALDPAPEAGWVLSPAAHGQGYATEAVAAALAWRDRALPHGPTSCIIAPENTASRRVAAKLGFVEIGQASYHGDPTLVLRRAAHRPAI